jgi:II/X family phage/plasmid replication protein
MIDTIKFYIPIPDLNTLELIKGRLMRFKKDDMRTGEVEFCFYTSQAELGSYNRTVNIRVNDNPQGLFLEFSIPKYEKGNNVEMIHSHDLLNIMTKMYEDFSKYLEYYELPPFSEWVIYRLDVCYNWLFNNKDEARYAMNFIQRIDYPRKKKYIYDTSVMYKGTAYTIKFYLKGPEFKKNDFKKIEEDRAWELLLWADKIMRFEVNLKRTYLNNFFGLNNVYVNQINDDQVILDILKYYLARVFKYINAKSMTEEKVSEILFSRFTKAKATRLYQFYKGYYFDEKIKNMYLLGGLNRSTIYRYKTELKEIGIGISLDDSFKCKDILEKLVIPSEDSKFDLIIKKA